MKHVSINKIIPKTILLWIIFSIIIIQSSDFLEASQINSGDSSGVKEVTNQLSDKDSLNSGIIVDTLKELSGTDKVKSQNAARFESKRHLLRKLIGIPSDIWTLTFYPLGKFVIWGESVRIDQQIANFLLNDGDRRAANTLDMYESQESEEGFVRHYLLDFGSALGSNNLFPHPPKYGNEYVFDLRTVFKSMIMLGFYDKPWAYVDSMQYTTTGYFESEIFTPQTWVPTYPNPAFENMTLRDAYWGTRIVASFTDEDIKTIVGTGLLSNPDAEAYLIKTLIERRDKIVSYWFSRMNPVDRFEIIKNTDSLIFRFSDLAVDAGVSNPDESSYMVNVTGSFDEESQEFILTKPLSINLKQFSASSDNGHNYKITIKTRWGNRAQWSKKVTIFIAYRDDSNSYEIASVKRDS